jgi:hypothetical protein
MAGASVLWLYTGQLNVNYIVEGGQLNLNYIVKGGQLNHIVKGRSACSGGNVAMKVNNELFAGESSYLSVALLCVVGNTWNAVSVGSVWRATYNMYTGEDGMQSSFFVYGAGVTLLCVCFWGRVEGFFQTKEFCFLML